MITSFFPGRVRLRAAVFKDQKIVEAAKDILQSSPAVKSVVHNPVTGSVLLEYDVDKVPMDKLTPLAPFFLKLQREAICYSAKKQESILKMLDELKSIVATW